MAQGGGALRLPRGWSSIGAAGLLLAAACGPSRSSCGGGGCVAEGGGGGGGGGEEGEGEGEGDEFVRESAVRLNEVSCKGGDEWVELVNVGDEAVDLAGYALTDRLDDPTHRQDVPRPLFIDAGEHRLVTLAAFGVRCGRETVHLVDFDDEVADQVAPPDSPPGSTWGRLPDGTGGWEATAPTPGAPNEPLSEAEVRINEVDCHEQTWVELVNRGGSVAALGGYAITTAPGDPALTFVLPDDAEADPGDLHVVGGPGGDAAAPGETFSFPIPCGAATVVLLDADGALADRVEVPDSVRAATWGRVPDGGGEFTLTERTPGRPNEPLGDPAAELFDPARVAVLDLHMASESVESLRNEPHVYVNANVVATFGDDPPEGPFPAGVRIKGRSGSLRSIDGKAAFRVDFDRADPGGRFQGIEVLALNNMVQDASKVQEWMAYRIFRQMGVPAPRVGYAWVRVNGADYGLYAMVETPDDPWMERHFSTTQHLYEGASGLDLFPDHLDAFEVDEGPPERRSDLQALIGAVNEAPPDGFFRALEPFLHWDEVVLAMATEVYIGHWDGYAPTRNNYFLHSDAAGRFTLIPWGTDQTFASDWPLMEGRGLLLQGCVRDPECRRRYEAALLRLANEVDVAAIEQEVRALQEGILPYAQRDPRMEHGADALGPTLDRSIDFLRRRRALVRCRQDPAADTDGDGRACDEDCAEGDPSVHAGARDECGDGVDQDCNGWPDDAPDCPDCKAVDDPGGGRYLFCHNELPWHGAREHCRALGADLPIVEDVAESDFLHSQAAVTVRRDYWLGLTDAEEEGTFAWLDGSPVTFEQWNAGEPNDSGGEDCAHVLLIENTWNDIACEAPLGVVCEVAR